MKYTLLDVVQIVLSSLDSDEVNSITDTTESLQVARIAQQAYLNIAGLGNLPETKTLFELNASLSILLPTIMYLPTTIQDVSWIKYNKIEVGETTPKFEKVDYICLEDFMDRMYDLDTGDSTVGTGTLTLNGADSITLIWKKNIAPTFWTSFDDRTILFDSYDSAIDSTLQKTKSLGYGSHSDTFTLSDNFIPDLDERQHPLWLNETKSLAWAELKQAVHQKAEQSARKGWVSLQKTKRAAPDKISELNRLPNYGRVGGGVVKPYRTGRNTW